MREKGEERYVLKEWKETEENGGGMGRSAKGVFLPKREDFPPEAAEEGDVAPDVGDEGTSEKPPGL